MTPATIGPAAAGSAVSSQPRPSFLPTGPRPVPPSALSASAAFGWRALLKIKHVPEQLFDVIAIPVVFTLGQPLPAVPPPRHPRHGCSAGHHVRGCRAQRRRVERGVRPLRSLPIWRLAPVAGALLGDVARYLLAASLVVVLGLAMGFRPAGGAPGVLAGIGLLVFALSLSWVWTTLGLLLRSPQAVMSAGTVVLFPLTLASNVFVRPQTMPGWLQAIVSVNPVSHLVTAERALMHGQAAAGQVGWVLLASAALVAVFAPITAYLCSRQR